MDPTGIVFLMFILFLGLLMLGLGKLHERRWNRLTEEEKAIMRKYWGEV